MRIEVPQELGFVRFLMIAGGAGALGASGHHDGGLVVLEGLIAHGSDRTGEAGGNRERVGVGFMNP